MQGNNWRLLTFCLRSLLSRLAFISPFRLFFAFAFCHKAYEVFIRHSDQPLVVLTSILRDLKPDNVMIDVEGHIALVDFGLAKLHCTAKEGGRTLAGSPAYTAPELLKPKKERSYGSAVDWWCLGRCTLKQRHIGLGHMRVEGSSRI